MRDSHSPDTLLDIEDLKVEFNVDEEYLTAVDGVSLTIEPGEIFGIVGESGSGKSVTAQSILQLIDNNGRMEAERLQYRDEDLLGKTEKEMQSIRGGEIGMIFQDPMTSLNPVMSVGEQVAEVVRKHDPDVHESTKLSAELRRKFITGTSKTSDSWTRAVELLETVGIPNPEQRAMEYPHQLSGGMRQRVVIAQALAGNPSLILADEPTTALDVSIEAQILNELLELKESEDISIILITHDLSVVREVCDRVAVMYCGEIMELAETSDLFKNPKHPYTEGLIESVPKLTDDKEDLSPIEGTVPDLQQRPTGCPFKDRCAYRFEECDEPLLDVAVDTDHHVRCHLYEEPEKRASEISGHKPE